MGKLHKLDNRIQVMLKNSVQQKYRTIFVMVGNKGQDQVPIMHQILNSLVNKGKLNILWCYKKEISFSTKKRKAGYTSDGTIFEQFICSTDIRWCYYHETHKVLGQTYDMCVLQDFEALTPNTLARTIETVSGGGLIVFLLKTMDSLRQLCTMAMDVHSRFRTEAYQDVVCRFNERFLLSLTNNSRCLLLDDRWNVLPLSRKVVDSIVLLPPKAADEMLTPEQSELQKLKVSLVEDGSPFAPLIKLCITLDQAKGLVQLCASLASTSQVFGDDSKNILSINTAYSLLNSIGKEKKVANSAIVIVTSGRGRGKSAALGLGLAAAIQSGMPNIFVTAPSPENLSTLIQFVIRGLNAFGYAEHQDYVAIRSLDPDYNQAVVRIDVHRQTHRQSIIYLPPWELANQSSLKQADLVCIDEAAAIPLPLVQSSINGPRLVFMASTVNGYEGTGRSLSLKLIRQLRNECVVSQITSKLSNKNVIDPKNSGVQLQTMNRNVNVKLGKGFRSADMTRVLYEVTLTEAIRYANGDPVESWLTDLLCLDCGETLIKEPGTTKSELQTCYPPVEHCQLYYVNRDTLFAYHKSTEIFLHRLMALYVASHYKNSPNDLQLLSDAPAHHIFCLLSPYDPTSGCVPEILCVLQVCFEGQITKESVLRSLSRGLRPSGDLIPWTISQQFCDPSFGELSGARVVRIATHPDYQGLGYGTRALKLLHEYYGQDVTNSNITSHPNPLDVTHFQSSDIDGKSEQGMEKLKRFTKCDKRFETNEEESGEENDDLNQLIDDDDDDDDSQSDGHKSKLCTESIERRGPSSLPPLLSRLNERAAEKLDYIGVSFGATPSLLRFWKRVGYIPVYIRQSLNNLTGEFTCIMLKQLNNPSVTSNENSKWLLNYFQDFSGRFIPLLPGPFRHMDAAYTLEILTHRSVGNELSQELGPVEVKTLFTSVDMERLHRYIRSLVDFHIVNDLLPRLARLYFEKRLPKVRLNKTQQVILLGIGLQHKTVEKLASEFNRLIGNPSFSNQGDTNSSKFIRPDDAVNSVLAFNNDGQQYASAYTGSMIKDPKKHKSSSQVGIQTGWARQIRGLLFVIVRELVRALDQLIAMDKSENQNEVKSKTSNRIKFEPIKGSELLTGKSVALHLDEIEEQDDQDDDDAVDFDTEMQSEDDDQEDDTVLGGDDSIDPNLSPTEIGRRQNVVRQLMSDELGAGTNHSLKTLSDYQIHGSETDWTQAVVGHGSDLNSLTVTLPKSDHNFDKMKKKSKNNTDRYLGLSGKSKNNKKNKMKLNKVKRK